MKKSCILGLISLAAVTSLTGCFSNEVTELDGVLILQAYGTGGKDECALSESFVELYNTTEWTISLDNSSLHYSEGGNTWEKFNLTGSIAPKTSFLITFDTCDDATNQIAVGDLSFDYTINNKGIKFCLMNNQDDLLYINPYSSNADGYIDMVCATDSSGTIDAAEGDYVIGQSKQKSVRRTSLTDTNDNSVDYEVIDYSFISASSIAQYTPKNQSYKEHDANFVSILEETSNTLLIYQVYGTGGKTDSAINRTYIELYNNSSIDVSLNGYSIQYMNYEETTWSTIELTGTIKAYSSFLIVGFTTNTTGVFGTLVDSDADMVVDFELHNDGFAVCLLSATTSLGTTNPFESNSTGFIDMVGSNMSYHEHEVAPSPSKQKTIIRTSLTDTNNNSNDFTSISFKEDTTAWETYAPKSSDSGSWTPFA